MDTTTTDNKCGKTTRCHDRLNDGFSLVEVLVSLILLASFITLIFSGFRYSAQNNIDAHDAQSATAYAQEVIESVRGMEIVDNGDVNAIMTQLATLLGNPAGGEITLINEVEFPNHPEFVRLGFSNFTEFCDEFDAGVGWDPDDFQELYTVVSYREAGINIGGQLYDMAVELNPLPYSVLQGAPGAGNDNGLDANNVNISALPQVENINGARFAVITDQAIGQYEADGVILQMISNEIQSRFNEVRTLNQIYAGLTKTVNITIADRSQIISGAIGGGGDQVQVSCEVEYVYNDQVDTRLNTTMRFNVYNENFELDCGEVCENAGHDATAFSGWLSGGRVYVNALAYFDPNFGGGPVENHINIRTQFATNNAAENHLNEGWDVFLFRSLRPLPVASFNFHSITVDGSNYYPRTNAAEIDIELWGEMNVENLASFRHTNFFTNVNGIASNLVGALVNPADAWTENIGLATPRLRNYEVTVTLTEVDSGNVTAVMTTTKKVD